MSAWEDFCLLAVNWLTSQWPSLAKSGINQWGLRYPPLTNLAVSDLTNYDAGVPMTGVCGIGSKESGHCFFNLSGVRLNGLDSIAVTAGQTAAFTTPDIVMTIPVTLAEITVAGSWSMQQACNTSTSYKLTGTGSFTASLQNADIVVTISGLNMNTGSATAVQMQWASSAPTPKVTALVTSLSGQPAGAPNPNAFAVKNYLTIGFSRVLQKELTGLLAGTTTFGSGKTLPSEILSLINEGFQQISLQESDS